MKRINLLIICAFILFSGQKAFAQTTFQDQHKAWIKAVNENKPSNQYWENATLFFEGEIYHGKEKIEQRLTQFSEEIEKITDRLSIKRVPHRENNFFDMGVYSTKKGIYCFIIGWKKVGDDWRREIEILFKNDNEQVEEIGKTHNDARNKWVELSNAHDHHVLVKEVYTSEAIYVNGGKMDQGTDQITKRYAYMSNPTWKIQLFPIQTLNVQDRITFEIGEYVSGGKGHYVIIWEQQENGEWQACLDFNF